LLKTNDFALYQPLFAAGHHYSRPVQPAELE
jgi:hypothetical protein